MKIGFMVLLGPPPDSVSMALNQHEKVRDMEGGRWVGDGKGSR